MNYIEPRHLPPHQLDLFPGEFQTRRFAFRPHQATRFHIDIRLEVFGVLRSFVIPELPSLDPSRRVRAVRVRDHNPKWLSERRIPSGRYGAGPMMVWDCGHYRPLNLEGPIDRRVFEALEQGLLDFLLIGQRLQGGFRLEREGRDWWFSKLDDEHATTEPPDWPIQSILSDKFLHDF